MSSSKGLSKRFGGSNGETMQHLEGSFLQYDTTSKKLVDVSSAIMASPRQQVIGERYRKKIPWTSAISQSKMEIISQKPSQKNIEGMSL